MKKTFELTHPKIKPARMVDAIKHEIKKYVKRERNKTLPKDADYWDFDCKYGNQEAEAQNVHLSAFNQLIDASVKAGAESFYVEIIARAAEREFIERAPFEEE